jgi:hypothetical protein
VIRKGLVIYLVIVIFFLWGFAVGQYRIFPASFIASMAGVVQSVFTLVDDQDDAGIESEHITSGISLESQMVPFDKPEKRNYQVVDLKKYGLATSSPLYFRASDWGNDGYMLIYGAYALDDGLHAAILFDSNFNVVHHWVKKDLDIESNSGDGQVHGLEVFPDGSIVFLDENFGNGIIKTDVCGKTIWTHQGQFNDVLQMDPNDGNLWTISRDSLLKLNSKDGAVMKNITWDDIHKANPDIAVFTPRRSLRTGVWYHNPIGLVDVEALSAQLSGNFPNFETGDLLLSFQFLNLVAVVDPDDLKIKWWRTGLTLRQQDVDWEKDGTISIFDNNRRENRNFTGHGMFHGSDRHSRIIKIDPVSMKSWELYNGKQERLYSGYAGKHLIFENGNIMLSSPQQGRAMIVSKDGSTLVDFINQFNDENALMVSEIKNLPINYFDDTVFENTGCL